MVALIVVVTIIVFIAVDGGLRIVMKRMEGSRIRKEREKALDSGLRLDHTGEAKSLKCVRVENPKARILAVDDEAVVLDSFRKILVYAGYSVDTVETGREALGLICKNEYDFVFTDLKMPDMDGLEVTKAVKHLRPEIDLVMITGYATVDSAVQAMKYGAVDHVQKPFTEDELADFVDKCLIRRADRLDKQIKPRVHLVTSSVRESASVHKFNVPAGIFVSPSHVWARIEVSGLVRVGLDDFAQKTIGAFDAVELPEKGRKVNKDAPLCSLRQGGRAVTLRSPVSGKIAAINSDLLAHPELIKLGTYGSGWICSVDPADPGADIQTLRIGAAAVSWYQGEIDKLVDIRNRIDSARPKPETPEEGTDGPGKDRLDDETWQAFSKAFLNA